MSRALPPLFEHGVPPPQQTSHLPSPVTPSQHTVHLLEWERSCMQYVYDRMLHNHNEIQRLQAKDQLQVETIVRQGGEIRELMCDRGRLNDLLPEYELVKFDNQVLISSHNQELREVDQQNADTLAQAVEGAKLQAEECLREIGKEVEVMKEALQREKADHEEEVDTLNTQLSSLQEASSQAKANADRLEEKCAELEKINEALESSAATQAIRLAFLETQAATAQEVSGQTEKKLRSDISGLEAKLDAAEVDASPFSQEIQSLTTQWNIEKLSRKRAEAAQVAAEKEAIGSKREAEELREKNTQLSEADLAATQRRKEVEAAAQQHTDCKRQISKLNANIQAKMILSDSKQKDLDERGKELVEARRSLENCGMDVRNSHMKNEKLVADVETLENALEAQKELIVAVESKRQTECKQVEHLSNKIVAANMAVKHLGDELAAKGNAVNAANKNMACLESSLETTKAALEQERRAHEASRREISGTENNAAIHLQARQEAESNLAKANEQLGNSFAKITDLELHLERSQKLAQDMKRSLDETKGQIHTCGENLRESEARAAQLEVENRDVPWYRTEWEQANERFVSAATPLGKRSRDSNSRESDSGCEGGPPTPKKLRGGADSILGASRQSHGLLVIG